MEIRYQVFVSSTFTDLREERQRVTQTLMEMDCIPSGMELFPAADEEQWNFIKKVINDCDYYLLIVGGRYGSLDSDGISYTEKEYDYAVEIGLKVIALIHGNPDQLPLEKSESDPKLVERLNEFRAKVSKSRLVKFWQHPSDLPGMVALSLQKTIKTHPARGWIRAGGPSTTSLLEELNEARKEIEKLQKKVTQSSTAKPFLIPDIAGLDEAFEFKGTYKYSVSGRTFEEKWSIKISWAQLFTIMSPFFSQNPAQETVKSILERELFKISSKRGFSPTIDEQDFQTIALQLKALGLVTISYLETVSGGRAWFWRLTAEGEKQMMLTRTIKTGANKS